MRNLKLFVFVASSSSIFLDWPVCVAAARKHLATGQGLVAGVVQGVAMINKAYSAFVIAIFGSVAIYAATALYAEPARAAGSAGGGIFVALIGAGAAIVAAWIGGNDDAGT